MKKILILGVILLAACKPQSKTAHTIRHNNTLKQFPPYAPFDSCVGAWQGETHGSLETSLFASPTGFEVALVGFPDQLSQNAENYAVLKSVATGQYFEEHPLAIVKNSLIIVQENDTFWFAGCKWKLDSLVWSEKYPVPHFKANLSPAQYMNFSGEYKYHFMLQDWYTPPEQSKKKKCECGYKQKHSNLSEFQFLRKSRR